MHGIQQLYFCKLFGTNKKYSRQNREKNTSLSQTGTINDKQCNVYDMAGNILEWTTETSSMSGNFDYPCVYRGGYCEDDVFYTSRRSLNDIWDTNAYFGFRPIVYLNV